MNKIIFEDGTIFNSAPYPIESEPPIFAKKILVDGINRDYLRITVEATYTEVFEKFINNAKYSIRQFDIDTDGKELETYTDYDWSEYSIAGDIIDHRDGRVTVYMRKPTQIELLERENAALLYENITGQVFEGEGV